MTRWIGSYCIKYQFGTSLVRNAQQKTIVTTWRILCEAQYYRVCDVSCVSRIIIITNNMNDTDIYIGPIYVDLFINVES